MARGLELGSGRIFYLPTDSIFVVVSVRRSRVSVCVCVWQAGKGSFLCSVLWLALCAGRLFYFSLQFECLYPLHIVAVKIIALNFLLML